MFGGGPGQGAVLNKAAVDTGVPVFMEANAHVNNGVFGRSVVLCPYAEQAKRAPHRCFVAGHTLTSARVTCLFGGRRSVTGQGAYTWQKEDEGKGGKNQLGSGSFTSRDGGGSVPSQHREWQYSYRNF